MSPKTKIAELNSADQNFIDAAEKIVILLKTPARFIDALCALSHYVVTEGVKTDDSTVSDGHFTCIRLIQEVALPWLSAKKGDEIRVIAKELFHLYNAEGDKEFHHDLQIITASFAAGMTHGYSCAEVFSRETDCLFALMNIYSAFEEITQTEAKKKAQD